jgi:hypothetical protein
MAQHASQFDTVELLRIIRLFNDSANEARAGWQTALPLELAFLTALAPEPAAGSQLNLSETGGRAKLPVQQNTTGERHKNTGQAGSLASEATPRQSEPTILPEGGGVIPASNPAVHSRQQRESPAEGGQDVNEELFRQVNEHWRQVINQVGQVSKQTQALLNSCKPYGVKSGVLFLGFNGDFAKTKMEKGDNIEITCRVLTQVMRREIRVRCFIAAGGKGTLPPDVESDGMVATALRELGGEVVDIQ